MVVEEVIRFSKGRENKQLENDMFIEEGLLDSLKRKREYIMDEVSGLETDLLNFNDADLQSYMKLLKVLSDKFLDKLGKLGDYSEYKDKKIFFDMYKTVKGEIEEVEREKRGIEGEISKARKEQEKNLKRQKGRKNGTSQFVVDYVIRQFIENKEEEKEEKEKLKEMVIHVSKDLLYVLFGFERERGKNNERLKESEKFVKKYEYDFGQLTKYIEQMESLLNMIRGRVKELGDYEQKKKEYELDNGFTLINGNDIQVKENVPEELESLVNQLKEKCVNSDRLIDILQKIYSGDKIIKSQYIGFWIYTYKLSIDSNELKSILGKVFSIKEVGKEGGNEDSNADMVEEVFVQNGSNEKLDGQEQDLEELQSIYDKLVNKEVGSEKLYECFLNILIKYFSLNINNLDVLIKQLKSFESTNHFYEYVLLEGKRVIKGDDSSFICLKYGTKKGYCVYKFLKGDSGARIIVDNDKNIIMISDHKTYIKYCGLMSQKKR